jgi:hypothetical protein
VLELLAVGLAAFVVIAVLGAIGGLVALVLWLVMLPFRILGFAFKLLGALLMLPFLALGGVLLAVLVGVPLLFTLLLPALPIVLLAWLVWWLVHRGDRSTATVQQ